jgi:hypothetical protein
VEDNSITGEVTREGRKTPLVMKRGD